MELSPPNSSFFKSFVHQCNDLVVITDDQARIVYVNPAFEKHTGHLLKNITGKNISIVKSGKHNRYFYKRLWKKLLLGKPCSVIFVNKKKSGELYYENKTITPIKGSSGKIEFYLSTSKDVTAEVSKTKSIEDKLQESQKIARIGTWEWNIRNDSIFWSEEIYRIFELSPKKFKPSYRRFLEIIHPDDRKKVEAAVNWSFENKSEYEIIHRLLLKEGRTKFVREKGYAEFSKSGKPVRMIGTVQDITNEVQLREDLNSAYITLQNSLNSVITSDLSGKILFANNSAVKMWGYESSEELLKNKPTVRDYWDIMHDKTIGQLKNILMNKGYYYSETPFTAVKKNGEKIQVRFNLSLIRDEQNEAQGITGSFFDVTEELKIKNEIREYDKKINLLLGNIDEVVFGVDALHGSFMAGKVFYLSPKSEVLMGFGLKDLDEDPQLWTSLIHPDDLQNVCQSNLTCIITKSTVTRTYRMRHRLGNHIKWFEEKITPFFSEEGQLTAFYGSARDVTERVSAELRLKESEKKYRSIFENALVAIFRTNITTQKAQDANDVCIRMFGYDSKNEFLEKFSAAEHYADPSERLSMFKDLGLFKTVKNHKMRFKRRDGTLFWGDASAQLISDEGIMEGVLVDVTEKHEYEEKLKNNLQEKELLLKEIHHRVKNNLQVISSLLRLQLNKTLNEEVKESLMSSYERIRAIALIHEKLYMSEDVSTINFSEYLANLTRSMLTFHEEKSVRLTFTMQEFYTNINIAMPLGLMCFEIISNAFKHAFPKVTKKELAVMLTKNDSGVLISIRDSGQGFDASGIDHVNTLGWKLIRNLAIQARAKVGIESSSTEGSEVQIVLQHGKA